MQHPIRMKNAVLQCSLGLGNNPDAAPDKNGTFQCRENNWGLGNNPDAAPEKNAMLQCSENYWHMSRGVEASTVFDYP